MKKLWNFVKETWKCYTSPNTLTYTEPNVLKISDLSAIFIVLYVYIYYNHNDGCIWF